MLSLNTITRVLVTVCGRVLDRRFEVIQKHNYRGPVTVTVQMLSPLFLFS
uniref:Uncharacterized protein n=1 Tax=Rhizophora mucronata TaxID=61149 RepID=A0A2P2NJ55_RHIMU